MADDIILTEEAIKESCAAAVVAAVAAFQAMTPEQQEEHMAAQSARDLAAFQALTPEWRFEHVSAVKAAEAQNSAAMADAAIPVLTPLNDNML